MAIVFDAPVAPDTLTEYVRTLPTPSGLKLLDLFPITNSASNEINLAESTRTNRVARFRAFDGRIHVADRDGMSTSKVQMAPFSDSLNMGEYERLQLEFARTGGTRTGALADAIYNDADALHRNMLNRIEMALGDVLADGVFNPGLKSEFGGILDFGIDAASKPTAAKAWTDPTADVLGDLIAWADAAEKASGVRPATVLGSRDMLRKLNTNTGLINAIKGAQTGSTRVSAAEVADLFAGEGLPTNFVAYDTQLDVDGAVTRVLPADKLVLLPPNPSDMLEFRLGISATALELVDSNEAEMSFEQAAGIVGVVEKIGPPYRQFTFIDAVGLPVLKDSRQLFVADVA